MNAIFRKHIVSIVVLIAIMALSLLVVLFMFYSMNTKIVKVLDTKERLSSYQKNNKAYIEESKQLKLLEKRVASLENNIINDQTLPIFLSSLEDLAQKGGVEFEITSVQNPVVNDKKQLMIDMSVKGSYSQVRSFLDQIQHQSYQIQLSNLQLFSENQPPVVSPLPPTTLGGKAPAPIITKEKQWRVIATINVLSF